ncbi:MAG: hypothetical protein IRZ00_03475 [Gemmatimonadetes bacterium]|nr:hypothetical protein [Gemmatimonadota bacterium]
MRRAPATRSRLGRPVQWLLFVGVVVAGITTVRWIQIGIDVVRNPWAHPSRGKTLTATWVARLTMPSGVHAAVFQEIRRAIVRHGRRAGYYRDSGGSAGVEGTWRWCDDTGLVTGDSLRGSMRGGALRLAYREPPGLRPGRTLVLTHSRGRWVPSDTLRVEADFSRKAADGLRWRSDDPDTGSPVPILFHRGDAADFARACRALAPSRPT